MRTVCKNVYKFDELTDEAKEKARDWYRRATESENFSLDEMMDSLKALFKAAGIRLDDWSVGPYAQGCYVKFDMGDAGELKGARAFAWLENNLFAPLRMTHSTFAKKRKDYMSYGIWYRAGKVPPCPLTGVCYDQDLIDSILKDVKGGDTLKEAFKNLADVVRRLNEAEIEYRNEDAQVDESITANDYEFDEDGRRA